MDIRRRSILGQRKAASSGGDSTGSYTVVLNSQWRKSSSIANPDSSLYDGVYESNSNYNINSTAATMYIDISGLSSFKLYIRSYAESNYDYVMVSQLDQTITNDTSYSNTTLVKAHTRGNQQGGTTLSNYILVEFTGIDKGSHRITVVYRKDGSQHSGNDRGYVLIPKTQDAGGGEDGGGEDGGDVDIDLTYSVSYTSTDNNIVTPHPSKPFNSNIVSNTYNTYDNGGLFVCDAVINTIKYQAFYKKTTLKSFTIPNSVTEIESLAFDGCTSLKSVTIGNSVTSIGTYAFGDCTSLTSVTIPNSVTEIGGFAFNGCTGLRNVTIPNSVTKIGASAFSACPLTSVTIPNSVSSIGEQAFGYCTSLTSVTIGNGITEMGYNVFYGCSGLTNVYISDLSAWCKISFGLYASNPLNFGAKLYLNGAEVTDITIPSDITEIKKYAFSGYSSLTSVTIGNGITSIGNSAFHKCTSMTSVTIGNSVTSIGEGAFNTCSSLTSVTIPNSVTSIGGSAFYGCSGLTSVTIGNNVTSIGDNAFYKCTSMTSVTIPNSVTSIEYNAFNSCTSLKEVYCKPTTPPTGGSNMFGINAYNRKIYVPRNSVEAYKADVQWSKYADYIVGYDF